MSYVAYKLIHFLGIFTLITVLSLAAAHALRGGRRADLPHRRLLMTLHGLAVFLILLGGFGMLARMGIVQSGLPGWIHAKLGIWVALAAGVMLPWAGPRYARALLVVGPLLAVAAGATALLKPF